MLDAAAGCSKMTCVRIPNGIVCLIPWGRLHVGNRYIWVDWHSYFGPSFWLNAAGTIPYEPDENDPVWVEYDKWLKKREARVF